MAIQLYKESRLSLYLSFPKQYFFYMIKTYSADYYVLDDADFGTTGISLTPLRRIIFEQSKKKGPVKQCVNPELLRRIGASSTSRARKMALP